MSNSKQLHIARHGKSSWDFTDIPDIDRPLNSRGINNAYMMAQRFAKRGTEPDLLLSSPANRALYTAAIFTRVLEIPWERIQINEDIYMGDPEDIMKIIKELDNNYSNVIIFGHNPTFTNFANQFLRTPIDNIPTAGIVSLTFSIKKWTEINNQKPDSEEFDFPKKVSG